MKLTNTRIFFHLLTLTSVTTVQDASANPERSLIVRSVQSAGESHLNIRASASEVDTSGVFPISTLDKNSFELKINGQILENNSISLTTFDASRRSNNRAIVWVYDATGVKTMPGLNKELRALTAQEFTSFNSDFISILGVTQSRVLERALLDPQHQDNTLALQRQLLADPVGLSPNSVFRESAICVAAQKFKHWSSAGLKDFDQKLLLLIGGSITPAEPEKVKTDVCLSELSKMRVTIHQIIFAKPERLSSRRWVNQPDVIKNGAIHRVVDTQGASRAIQSTRNILDKEYVITAQVMPVIQASLKPSDNVFRLTANYHGSVLQSNDVNIFMSRPPATLGHESNRTSQQKSGTPPRLSLIDNKASLAINAWLEWLATAVLIGIIVTIRHMKRIETGVFSIEDASEFGDTSQGPLLLVLNGKDKGREFRIRQRKVVLGRGLFCDLRLRGQRVKRKHGCLTFQADKALLEDLSNGNLAVNGRPLRHLRIIGHGSVIQLGDLQLLFRCGDV